MSRALLALVLMLAAAPSAVARDALAAIDDCIHQLEPELDVGYGKVAARCPDLAPSLKASPFGAWLPSDWDKAHNNLSVRGLRQLRTLIERESARSAARPEPSVERVAGVLASLRSPAAERGWWARFKAWLHQVFAPRVRQPESGWLRELMARLAPHREVLDLLAVGAMLLVAVLAAVIVVGELRAAGLLGRRRPAATRSTAGARSRPAGGGWADIERAQLREQPRLLLELIAARLAALDLLPPARALTVRELIEAVRLPEDGDRERLAELAAVSERLRFSDRVPGAPALEAALRRGRELLAGLEAVPA